MWLQAYADAMRRAQGFEEAMLTLLLKVRRHGLDEGLIADLEKVLASDFKRPLRNLLAEIRDTSEPRVTIEPEVEITLEIAIEFRNYLAHRHFRVRRFDPTTVANEIDVLRMLGVMMHVAEKLVLSLSEQAPGDEGWIREQIQRRSQGIYLPKNFPAKVEEIRQKIAQGYYVEKFAKSDHEK